MTSGEPGWSWPGLSEARQEAARRGASSVGTQHLLFALLSRSDEDAVAALQAGGIDPASATEALNRIVGVGSSMTKPVGVESVRVSSRVEAILEHAAGHDAGHDGPIRDRDVLRALLTSDDPAVGHLIVTIVSDPHTVVDALDSTHSGTGP